ncbi:MAG: dihydrodipicolinate reductase C-terminal domain-containing protein [Methylobacter sp.]|uniref:4-hydroxy-tetrahydrodipicolinate reductase n=1 Tax=Methylobacter sp. TaxID=2051955 RepID=UPI00273048A2|nr:dihydrodipicolinate reductase C-terminal domain-containing protein [Methylobacter sp.]MDP1667317.1 dihydrodipicolinate reductase C-terminal domain-containing protein [Methylobacter sp.]
MKVGLIGFGKTGKAVASILLENKEVNLQWVIRKTNHLEHRSVAEYLGVLSDEPGLIYSKNEFTAADLLNRFPVDVIIDFSSQHGIEYYGDEAGNRGIAIVSAISSYSPEEIQYLEQLSNNTKILWSPNITVGINFLMIAAKILKNIAPYTDIEVIEEHFKNKPETSGTAKKIAHCLDVPEDAIKTIRAGGIIGVHEILFGFPHQTVRLKHESIAREAFGNGALFAAKHILNKNNGLYSMEDLLLPYFQYLT